MKNLKVILVLVLVFAAGFAGGVVVTRGTVRHFVHNAIANPDLLRGKIERDLSRQLQLDHKQREQVHDIFLNFHRQMLELRREFQPRVNEMLEHSRKDITAILTPEQQQRFERYQAENGAILKPRGMGAPKDD